MTPSQFKSHRQRLGLSLRAFARLVDCSHTQIERIESGALGDPIPRRWELVMLGVLKA